MKMKNTVTRILSAVMLAAMLITGIPCVAEPAEAASNIVMNGVDIGYANGSYFTKNGKSCKNTYWKKGRCHKNGVCEDTTHTQCNCMRYWPTGVASTAQVDLKSSQCFAFARYCQWRLYGVHDCDNPGDFTNLGSVSSGNCTGSNLKSKLKGVAAATHVRTKSTVKGWAHSVSVVSTSDSGITIADCNSDGYCKVREKYFSWADFASYMKEYGGIDYINVPKNGSTHTHDYQLYYETAHPHKLLNKCESCGDRVYTGGTYTVKDCASCNGCSCSDSYAGEYKCTTSSASLTIRSGHGTNYSKIGSIPSGATVTVTKANGSWAHVTYNGVSGYASMQYLQKKTPAHAETPTLTWWLSESAYGKDAGTLTAGKSYYLCYRLYDAVTGKDWDEVADSSYNVKLTVYAPDGSTVYSWNNSSDTGWIRTYYSTSGSYSRELVLTGDFGYSGKHSYTVKAPAVKIYASATSANLTLGGTESVSVKIWDSGNYSDRVYYNWKSDNKNVTCSWGSWADDGSIPLTITANKRGTATVTVSIGVCDTDRILATVTIKVNVSAKTYTVYYNANGGSGAPSAQTKYHGETLKLTTAVPTRSGYTFKGWAKSPGATTPDFKKGASYTVNAGDTLYAVWDDNPFSGLFGSLTGVNLGLVGSVGSDLGRDLEAETEDPAETEPESEAPEEGSVEGAAPAVTEDGTANESSPAEPEAEADPAPAEPEAEADHVPAEPEAEPETDDGVPGDVNGDGVVNSIDIGLISRKLNGGNVSENNSGDVNGDGRVTAADMALLRRKLSGAKA